MKIAVSVAAVALALSACGKKVEPGHEEQSATRIEIDGGFVREIRLADGTPCVIYTRGGIDCNWGGK